MSQGFVDNIAEQAMVALKGDDPEAAARKLRSLLRSAPERLDLHHALAITELRLGDPAEALKICAEAEALANEQRDERAGMIMPQLMLVKASAAEDLRAPEAAAAAYQTLLEHEPLNPRAKQGLAWLLLAWGRLDDGMKALEAYIEDKQDEPPYIEGAEAFLDSLRALVRNDIHPEEFLKAHRGSYCEMFNHYAEKMAEKGWIAEAARMTRTDEGELVPVIPEGARPYAAVRIDLVDPNTGQPGRVGEQPMMVALAEYQPLARAPVLVQWPARDWPFPLHVSSQCPWNDLSFSVRFADGSTDAVAALDPVIGDWYTAGYNGHFGSQDAGRFHEVSDLEPCGPGAVRVSIDAGRAEVSAVPDLLRRLTVLHGQHPIAAVLIGRGFLPA